MTNRIEKAIDIFLDAVNNGTLAKGTCTACAVGNLVAHGMNGTISKRKSENGDYLVFRTDVDSCGWSDAFVTTEGEQSIYENSFNEPWVLKNVEATDFTIQELAQIEFTFETNTEIHHNRYNLTTAEEIRADQIKGLEAVVKLMMTFDDVKADVKEVFTNKLQPVS